jgi:1-deoxy-D-xylulose 5-phosphate reductoisomerase
MGVNLMRSVIVLGSTGSIGTQTLEVIRESISEFKANQVNYLPGLSADKNCKQAQTV